MKPILERFREVTTLLQKEDFHYHTTDTDAPFRHLATTLSRITDANIYILDVAGQLLGSTEQYPMNSSRFSGYLDARQFPNFYMNYLDVLHETVENISANQEVTIFPVENKDVFGSGITTIVPIVVSGQRLGYLILARLGRQFDTEDLILAEYSATVVGIELMHFNSLKTREKIQEKEQINLALRSLSYSETEAVKYIFSAIDALEMRITASKIAEEHGLTRSVIVNALRKLESAGILTTRSLGMKGTIIKANSQMVLDALKSL